MPKEGSIQEQLQEITKTVRLIKNLRDIYLKDTTSGQNQIAFTGAIPINLPQINICLDEIIRIAVEDKADKKTPEATQARVNQTLNDKKLDFTNIIALLKNLATEKQLLIITALENKIANIGLEIAKGQNDKDSSDGISSTSSSPRHRKLK